MITEIFCFYLQNRLIRTGQTGGQLYSDASPFSVPCLFSNINARAKQRKEKYRTDFFMAQKDRPVIFDFDRLSVL